MTTLENILEEIKKANSIVLLTHENPDGDAIGSSLAVYMGLKTINKDVDLIIPEVPKTFSFLPCINEIKKEGKKENYDLAISLDCASIKRLNGWASYFENAKSKIVIDHHGSNTMYGDFNFVNPDSPACSQVLISMFEAYGMTITKDMGTCLLTGIVTDTGGFQYQSTTPETFEFAANLLKSGVNVSEICKKALDTKSRANFELRKIAMDRMEFFENGKIAFTYFNKKDIEETNAETGDHEGIVNEGRSIEGVEVSIFLRETDEGYKASLRSNEYVNVSDVCMIFGGGGHIRAAGCTIDLPFEQAKERIINQVKMYL